MELDTEEQRQSASAILSHDAIRIWSWAAIVSMLRELL